MPSRAVSDLIERVAGKEEAGVGEGKVCAEFEHDLPDLVEPLCEGVDGLCEELLPAGAFLDEGALGVTRELEEERGDLCLFRFEIQGGHACVPSVHVCGGRGCLVAPVLWDDVEEGREVPLDEQLLRVGRETLVDIEEPGRGRTMARPDGAILRTFCSLGLSCPCFCVSADGDAEASRQLPFVAADPCSWRQRDHVGNARTSLLSASRSRLSFVPPTQKPMSSHSPHRSRKQPLQSESAQSLPRAPVHVPPGSSPPREMSPSPRQRTAKAQSLPIVPSVMQVFNHRQLQHSPSSANTSRRSTTPPPNNKLPSPPLSSEDLHTPPPHPNLHPTMGYPRPINRIPLAAFHALEENWQMTDELMAEIERADYAQTLSQQPAAPGTSGVAYAGGAQSGAVYVREAPSPHKDTVLRTGEHYKDGDNPPRRPPREREREPQPSDSIQARNRPLPASPGNSPSYSPQGHPQARGPSPDRVSPPYHTPQGSSGESATPGDYVSLKRESYQSSARIPTPPTARKSSSASNVETTRATPPAASKLASQTPPLQAMKTRTPDKSLPVQEEPEDDVAASLKDNAGHLHYDHGGNPPHDDDDDTLIETETGYMRPGNDNDRDGDSGSYTPRSPSVTLPESYSPRHYASYPNNRLANLTKHHRNGSTDQLGLRSFDAVVNPKSQPRPSEETRESPALLMQVNAKQTDGTSEEAVRHQNSRTFNDNRDDRGNRGAEQPPNQVPTQQNIRPHQLQTQVLREDQYYDDAAAAYLQTYFQSIRPNAPIPPTPHSQTAAPTPSPFISSIQPSPAPPVGSPYPYPFTHLRRNPYPVHTVPTAPSSNYDPNHPSVIEEQLALQMQMYALNNNAAPMSDSTFSPSSTPFPGPPAYNPWAFLQASRAFGGRRFDSMSLQSSPSHQPVSLPYSASRGRGLKRREKSSNLRTPPSGAKQKTVKPPPRVDSTQPRDTSPEPYSSGEETAGEGYEVHEEAAWVNGDAYDGSDDAEWIDEDFDKDELLDLEYHPSFIANVDKRRRKWDARWDALQQAVRTFLVISHPVAEPIVSSSKRWTARQMRR